MTAWRSSGHRGDELENLLDLTHEFYKKNNLGRVDKVNVPIKVITRGNNGMITKAFFEKKSTVDFHGVIQGTPIVFDAKETTLKSLPLQNIHDHQIEYMKDITYQGGLAFLIIHFKFCDDYYLVPFEILWSYYKHSKEGGRKSIPYKSMNKNFHIVRERNGILNYLPILNNYIEWKNAQENYS